MNKDKPLKLSTLSVYNNWPSLDFLHQFWEVKLCSGFPGLNPLLTRLITKVRGSTSSSIKTLLISPLPAMHFGVLIYDLKSRFFPLCIAQWAISTLPILQGSRAFKCSNIGEHP